MGADALADLELEMRNLLKYPITKEEVVRVLRFLSEDEQAYFSSRADGYQEAAKMTFGSVNPMILEFAARAFEQMSDEDFQSLDLALKLNPG